MMPFWVQAQLTYTPVVVSQCSGEELDFYTFSISGKGQKYKSFDNTSLTLNRKTLEIGDTGTYQLSIGMIGPGEVIEKEIYFTEFEAYTDTFNTPALRYNMCICNPPPENYFFCGDDPDGWTYDYYHDGSVRARGNFNNGYLVDSLIEYHRNGNIRSVKTKLKGTKKAYGYTITLWDSKKFSKEGVLIYHYNNKREFTKNYYPDGQLKRHVRFKGGTKEYYSNGQLKFVINKSGNRKTIFSEEGDKLIEWKKIKWRDDFEYTLFTDQDKIKTKAKLKEGETLGPNGFPEHLEDIIPFPEEKNNKKATLN